MLRILMTSVMLCCMQVTSESVMATIFFGQKCGNTGS